LTQSEFESYLSAKQLPDRDILKKRYAGCMILYDKNGNGSILDEKDFLEFIESLTKRKNIDDLKGMPAFKGLVRGRVRVILDPMNPGIFEEGDILVAGMTRPEYLQLMQKSGGFITDAGGLLSHAAIVARELKKPCVIGTEVATKVLKDGDLVELDANTGIIRKI
jgi:phosphoenolpyruvate synthase/pyruvate phosphate dikinase